MGHKMSSQLIPFNSPSDFPIRVLCNLRHIDVTLPAQYDTVTRRTRCWRSFDVDAFLRDVSDSPFVRTPPTDVDELFTGYFSTFSSLLDVHAPVRLNVYPCAAPSHGTTGSAAQKNGKVIVLTRATPGCPSSKASNWFRSTATKYWLTTIEDCHNDTRLLWSKVGRLLQLGDVSLSHHTAADLATQFTSKVDHRPPPPRRLQSSASASPLCSTCSSL